MKQTTSEWIDKAEADWHVAQMSYCAQQCIEKYLKARLEEASFPFQRTHDLLLLHQVVLTVEPSWQALQIHLAFLNPFAVAFRYPGMSATKADAKDAIRHCRAVRKIIRLAFGLPV